MFGAVSMGRCMRRRAFLFMLFGNFTAIGPRIFAPLNVDAAARKNICAQREDKKCDCQTNEEFSD
jgi:hypothetical protein